MADEATPFPRLEQTPLVTRTYLLISFQYSILPMSLQVDFRRVFLGTLFHGVFMFSARSKFATCFSCVAAFRFPLAKKIKNVLRNQFAKNAVRSKRELFAANSSAENVVACLQVFLN